MVNTSDTEKSAGTGTSARIAPLPPEKWSTELTSFIFDFRTAVIGDKAAEDGPQSGRNLLGTLANSPALTTALLAFNGHILYGSKLTARQRELTVLRIASLRHADYEWAQHTLLALDAGVSQAEIDRVAEGPDAPGWNPLEAALLRAVDELIADAVISDGTWRVLAQEFDEQQLIDLVFTVGTYEMMAFALRSFGVQGEAGLLPYFPKHQ